MTLLSKFYSEGLSCKLSKFNSEGLPSTIMRRLTNIVTAGGKIFFYLTEDRYVLAANFTADGLPLRVLGAKQWQSTLLVLIFAGT